MARVATTWELIPRQDPILMGGPLGDMHIQRTRAATELCRLRFCYGIAEREYVDWKYAQFREKFCQWTKPP